MSSDATVIRTIAAIDRTWLEAALRKNGGLTSGRVSSFRVRSSASTHAQIVTLSLDYSPDALGRRPRSLILKMCQPGSEFVPESEVNYYSRDYTGLVEAPLPICYDARFSRVDGAYHLLTEDISGTHRKDTPPTLAYGLAVASALATLHAYGWGPVRIEALHDALPATETLDRYLHHIRQGLSPMLDAVASTISPVWREVIGDIFARHPATMLARIRERGGFAVVHGDLNPGNIFYAAAAFPKVYFLDRQPFQWSLTTWLGVSDLAYMMVPFWEPSARRELELPILREYHRQLSERGVADYPWEQLLSDYKLAVVQCVYVAAEWCIQETDRERMRWLWFAELTRAMQAITELDCWKVESRRV